jgi:hypothetical protein
VGVQGAGTSLLPAHKSHKHIVVAPPFLTFKVYI